MRTQRVIAWACLLVIASTVAVAVRTGTESRSKSIRSRQIISEVESAARRIALLRARLAAVESERGRLSAAQAVADAPKKPARKAEFLEMLHSDPVVQARFVEYQKSGFTMLYGPLFRKLSLSPDQVSQFEAALARRAEADMDLNASLIDQHLSVGGPEAQKLYRQNYAECTASLAQVLGEAGLKEYDAYDQGLPARSAVTGFAGAAAVGGMPLTSEQLGQLTALAIQAPVGPAGPQWDGVIAQASSFLSPSQADLLRTGEFRGPGGYGSQYLFRLNSVITAADNADSQAGFSGSAAAASPSPR